MMNDFKTKDAYDYYMSNNIALADAAKKYNVTAACLYKRFKKANLKNKSRNSTREKPIDADLLKDMYLVRNMSFKEISKALGVSRGTVGNRVTELGINKCSAEAKSDRDEHYTYWSEERSRAARKMLEETRDMRAVARKFGLRLGAIENKNMDWKVDLSANSCLFGIPTFGEDGIKYRSRLEAKVADWLLSNDIEYQYEVRVCEGKQWTCDFVVNGIWIEIDGLGKFRKATGAINYSNGHKKIKYYKDNGFNFRIVGGRKWKSELKKILGL